MANKYTSVSDLFSDIAGAIRTKEGSSDAISASDFPDRISALDKTAVTQWTDKFYKIISPEISTVSAAITVKGITYYDGFWYAVGNDSAGDAYKLYGSTLGNLTAVKIGTGRNYPATGIVCDGTYVFIVCAAGSYNNRVALRQTVADFLSSDTTLNAYANATYYYSAACRVTGNYKFAFGGYVNGDGGAFALISGTSLTWFGVAANIKEAFVDCCAFNETAVAVTPSGYVGWFKDLTGASYKNNKRAFLQGAQRCRQMGDYFCVACTKDDGTYLYYTSGDPINDVYGSLKITDEVLTIVGMAYTVGLNTLDGVRSEAHV